MSESFNRDISANLAKELKDVADPEEILAVIIGSDGAYCYFKSRTHKMCEPPLGKLLSWVDAQKYLDYDYNRDTARYIPECPAVYAWTDTLVLFVNQYDGSTRIEAIPRNPTELGADDIEKTGG